MIGFSSDLLEDLPKRDELDETRSLDKRRLYDSLAHKWYLAPIHSKMMNREYLLAVFAGSVFRVGLLELKHFEVELTPKMTRRVGIINNGILVKKLNELLKATNRPPLGFEESDPPDQGWLYRVARFLDPTNLTEFFEEPVYDEPPINERSSDISITHFGRVYASTYFFREKAVKTNKKLWESLRQISDSYRSYMSQKIGLEVMKKDLNDAEQKFLLTQLTLDDMISKAGFTYSTILDSRLSPQSIISGGSDMSAEDRKALLLNCKL